MPQDMPDLWVWVQAERELERAEHPGETESRRMTLDKCQEKAVDGERESRKVRASIIPCWKFPKDGVVFRCSLL